MTRMLRNGTWAALVPIALLALAIATPSAGLLWFMVRAVDNERLAIREELTNLVQGEAELRADAAAQFFGRRLTAIQDTRRARTFTYSPAGFKSLVSAVPIGGFILLDADGTWAYPADPEVEIGPLPGGPLWEEAQRLEFVEQDYAAAIETYQEFGFNAEPEERLQDVGFIAMGRCAAKKGDLDLAVTWLTGIRVQDPLRDGLGLRDNRGNIRNRETVDALLSNPYPDLAAYYDENGSLLPANALNQGLRILSPARFGDRTVNDPHVSASLESTLRGWLHDYETTPMRPLQRQLLMAETLERQPFPDDPALSRLLQAEQTVQAYRDRVDPPLESLEAERLTPVDGQQLWLYRPGESGRIVWVLRRSELEAVFISSAPPPIGPLPSALRHRLQFVLDCRVSEDGGSLEDELARAPFGPALPGWSIVATGDLPGIAEDTFQSRTVAYAWIGLLLIVVVGIASTMLSWVYFRQLRVTRLKNDLIATVSHELRTPLASMRVLVETLLEERLPDPKARKEYLALIAQENTRLSRMVENFLAFSRMERNTFPLRLEQVAVGDLIDETRASVADRFAAAGRPLTINVTEDCPELTCDPDAIATALVNLLDNAHKFTPDGSAPIALHVSRHNGELCMAVRDRGIGLNRRAAARVFRRYYQVDQRLARAADGCGLGLSIVDHIMNAHGGRVTVESTPGEGSTFTLHLPLAPADESSP